MSLVDAAQIASAIAACGALIAAVVQVRGLRRDALEGRVGEILGVAVDTQVVIRPVTADQPGGRSLWEYRFTVHNPGRFPITSIEVRVDFPLQQQRVHYNKTLDQPSSQLEMIAPVIPANTQKSWTRRIIINHAERKKLRDTVASVSFEAPDVGRWTTKWPDPEPSFRSASIIRSRLKSHRG